MIPKKRLPRQEVLILIHADGHLEAFAEKHVDVHIARVPKAFSADVEQTAEAVAELMLPRLYRNLWRADRLRGVGTTRPLLPSVLADSRAAKDAIKSLNRVKDIARPVDGAAEAAARKLARERRAAS